MQAINGLVPSNEALINQYEDHIVIARDLPRDVAKHLVHTYGTASLRIVDLGEQNASKKINGQNERVHKDYPFLKSEIAYAAKFEMAQKPNDVLCRRVPIGLLDQETA